MADQSTDVLIVGAGPVGLTLALDLGRRGVHCTLIERNSEHSRLPKMERCNARTMEIYRRLGVVDAVRQAGLPCAAPMDVFLTPSLAEAPLAHLALPSVTDARADIAAHNDGTRLLEPYQVISQYTLEPLLRQIVEALPTVCVRFGCELTAYAQDADGVTGNTSQGEIRSRYLVGCDGGSSTVRKQMGIRLAGRGGIRTLRQALFSCPELYPSLAYKGRHYHVAQPPLFPFLILQDSTRHWTLHAGASSDAEMAQLFAASIGTPVPFEMLSVNEWTQHLLCAERYADGRVFIAGDAAHLVIPTGGLGMNTGVGDATDLGWKLAATLAGWGGPGLLRGYEAERRPVALRNVEASGAAMAGRDTWRAATSPEEMARRFDVEQRKVTDILGIEAGYVYRDSPLVAEATGEPPDFESRAYVPTTWPGARLPHVWLDDGAALHDQLPSSSFTLLRLGGSSADIAPLAREMRALGAPLEVLDVSDTRPREIYGFDVLLVRPDLHVVWRGNIEPSDPRGLAARVTGH